MDARAKSLLKGKGTLDQDVGVLHDWRPSAWELSHHKDFSKEMVVSGRIVVRHVLDPKGKRGELFPRDQTGLACDLFS